MPPEALLAIRSDIVSDVEPEYLEWLTREHTLERVGIEGFLSVRIFRSKHPGFGRYLIFYELAHAGVVDSAAYLERLNHPTPWTTRMMPHLGNFVRGGGVMLATSAVGYGASLVPVMLQSDLSAADLEAVAAISKHPGMVASRVLRTDRERTIVATNERKLRSGDQSFVTLLMLEALDDHAARRAARELPRHLQQFEIPGVASEPVPLYSLIFSLTG